MIYKSIIRPILFKTDPEWIHDRITSAGIFYGKFKPLRYVIGLFCNYNNPMLSQDVGGIHYSNPIGLAAGFDKNSLLTQIMPSMGFGYEEIGSVTALPCEGNAKPRLWRLPKHKSLVVYYGLKNDGCKAIAARLGSQKRLFPVGISIAKTNCKATVDEKVAIEDYYESYVTLEPIADYITINISCPNAYGGQPFSSSELLDRLLLKLDTIKSDKPRYIKLSPDLSEKEIDELLTVVKKHNIQGFVISNLVKNRESTNITAEEFEKVGSGGLSGKVVDKVATKMISDIYQKTSGKYTIIGCGGVFTAQDAYEKLKAGASLIQLITGMIYGGPLAVRNINKGLVKLMKKDGYTNISQIPRGVVE